MFSVIFLFFNRIGNFIIHKYDNLTVNLYLIILLIVSLLQYLLIVSHTAFEWTTTQDIPLLLRMLDPDYLKNDFYTNAAINAPRHGFRWLISVPIILGLDWYKAIYLCKVIVYIIYKPLMFLAMYTVINGWCPLKGTQKESIKFILFIFVTFELFHLQGDGGINLAGWHHPYGNLIIISHGNGYFSLHGHNVQNLVKEKQRVKRGELIALVGETGVTSGPHLHFEIWKDGKVVDPAFFIAEYRSDYMTLEDDEKK